MWQGPSRRRTMNLLSNRFKRALCVHSSVFVAELRRLVSASKDQEPFFKVTPDEGLYT